METNRLKRSDSEAAPNSIQLLRGKRVWRVTAAGKQRSTTLPIQYQRAALMRHAQANVGTTGSLSDKSRKKCAAKVPPTRCSAVAAPFSNPKKAATAQRKIVSNTGRT